MVRGGVVLTAVTQTRKQGCVSEAPLGAQGCSVAWTVSGLYSLMEGLIGCPNWSRRLDWFCICKLTWLSVVGTSMNTWINTILLCEWIGNVLKINKGWIVSYPFYKLPFISQIYQFYLAPIILILINFLILKWFACCYPVSRVLLPRYFLLPTS